MLFGKMNSNSAKNFEICINHYPIESKNSIRYLRVKSDKELSWKTHTDYLAKKLSKVRRMISF